MVCVVLCHSTGLKGRRSRTLLRSSRLIYATAYLPSLLGHLRNLPTPQLNPQSSPKKVTSAPSLPTWHRTPSSTHVLLHLPHQSQHQVLKMVPQNPPSPTATSQSSPPPLLTWLCHSLANSSPAASLTPSNPLPREKSQ